MKIIIHFGVHRTGSTSIQNNLIANRETLKTQGFLYPFVLGAASHARLANMPVNKALDDIKRQITPSTHTIILSSEDFCTPKKIPLFKKLATMFDLSAVVYLRRQDLWLESWYNQHIKWPWSKKFSGSRFNDFLKHSREFHWIDYHALLQRINQYIPADDTYVRIHGSEDCSDTLTDFCSYCGIYTNNMTWHDTAQNASLTSVRISILSYINILHYSTAERIKIIDTLSHLSIPEDNGSYTFLNTAQRDAVLSKFAASNRAVARQFFSRDDLFEPPDTSLAEPAYIPEYKIKHFYIPRLVARLARQGVTVNV